MGFWSSLVNTAVGVTHWVSNNAGSISNAAGVVAKIVGAVAMTEEEIAAEGDNILPRLRKDFEKAEEVLQEAAVNAFPRPLAARGDLLKTVDLPGLWPTPGSVDGGRTIPEIAIDINKLLAYERIPVNLKNKDSGPVDIGAAIADQLFVSSETPQIDAEKRIFSNPVNINYKGKPIITGGMVYYKLPLGNAGNYDAWHSFIRLHYVSSDDNEKEFQEERLALSIQQEPYVRVAGKAYNSVTLSVQWNGSRAVAPMMTKAVQTLLNKNKNIKFLKPAVIDGTRFKYQFETEITVGPAEVAAKLSTCISDSLPPPDKSHPLPRMPTIKVSNLQAFI